jgi:small conductance mechanosensitive channel
MEDMITQILAWGQTVIILTLVILAHILGNLYFKRRAPGKESNTISRQVINAVIFAIGALIVVISLPIDSGVRGQIISLIGIVISAALALSAPTVFSNALAGIMNANMKNVNLGDFIRIENHFGRVTKKGLFRTEIQTEDRNLLSFPNLYLASQPIKIIRESGTIVSTTVSLGYDVDRAMIEKHLLEAATEAGLSEPYVYITKLGDFAVSYKIHGLLAQLNKYLTMAAKFAFGQYRNRRACTYESASG